MFGSTTQMLVRRSLLVLALVALAAAAMVGASFADGSGHAAGKSAPNNAKLVVYCATSVHDSGLMQDVVLPAYNTAHPGITVNPTYVGSGAAIQAARDGLADVIIVCSPPDEKQLLTDGVATFASRLPTTTSPSSDPRATRPRSPRPSRPPTPSSASPPTAPSWPPGRSPLCLAATPPAPMRRSCSSGTQPA